MQKQLFPIPKHDWFVVWSPTKSKKSGHKYFYAQSRKEGMDHFAGKRGYVQLFKMSYEFRSVKDQTNDTKKKAKLVLNNRGKGAVKYLKVKA